jgi:pyrophosphatase PpaX
MDVHLPAPPRPRLSGAAVHAVVFDFDGTLVATRSADEVAVAELIASDPSAAAGAEVFWAHDGEPILTRIELAWPGRGAEVLPLFERQAPPRPYPGVARLLEGLARHGLPMAVVSSRRRAPLEAGLAATRLGRYFQVVVGLDDVREPKPSPEGLLLAMRRLGVAPEWTVYVGDNPVDVEAGHRAGMTVWRAVWGTPPASPNGAVLRGSPAEVGERLARLQLGPE